MPRIARIIAPDSPHHITQRGNNRMDVFYDDEDRYDYLKFLKIYSEKWNVRIWAYCLMTNHVHILAVPEDEKALSRCIGGTNLVYTQHVNRKYNRNGRLWQNRFFSTIIENESYLWAVLRYIEQNPVKANLANRPEDYRWSSCLANITGDYDMLIANHEWLSDSNRDEYRAFLMQKDQRVDEKIRKSTSSGRPLGSAEFVAALERKFSRKLIPNKVGRPKQEQNSK